MCCNVSLADADYFFVDFAILMNQFIIQCIHGQITSDIKYNIQELCHYSSYGRKKQDSFLKKEMFTSDTFLNVKQSCILVIRVVFKVQLKDLMTANTKNI